MRMKSTGSVVLVPLLLALLCALERPMEVEAGKVLGIFQFPASSHFGMFEALMKELAARGHQVTVLSHFPQKTPVANYTDVSLAGSYRMMAGGFKIEGLQEHTLVSLMNFVWEDNIRICERAFEHPNIQKLLKSQEKYDLIITEIFGADCAYGFAWKFGAPIIGISSLSRMPWGQLRVGNIENPAYFPVVYMPYTTHMTFWQRFLNTAAWIYSVVGERFTALAEIDALNRKYFGSDIPPLDDLIHNTSLVFINSHFTLNGALPEVPGVVEVAGLHVEPQRGELPKELKAWVDGADERGVLYVSFGSLVHVEEMPLAQLEAMTVVLGALPMRVVWKCDGAKAGERLGRPFPKNIYSAKWMPQAALLAHPKVRAFVSHGGLGGTIEAVFWGKPVLMVPLFADQHTNADNLIDRGMARKILFPDINEKEFGDTLNALLNDPSYTANARRLSALFHDRPRTPREEAVHWSEYVMRHRGAAHMRSAAVNMRWWQIWLLDVVGAVLAVVAALGAAVLWLCRCLCGARGPAPKLKRS